jgi:Secretion system C-terminal sorting domain
MKVLSSLIFLSSLANFCIGQNVLISNNYSPNETSIMIDPKHPNVLIAGANLDNYYISLDTGQTWSEEQLNSSYGVWGDPTIAVDTNSSFYFFHLSNPNDGNWIDRIVCQKTSDNGSTWSDGSYTGLNGTKAQDKQWCAIDRVTNNMYITWSQFDDYGSSNPLDSSNILFSKSLDGGATWSTALRINKIAGDCIDSDNTVEGAVPAVGTNGEIFVAWAGPNGLVFNRSLDQGETWLENEVEVSDIPGGWDYTIPGISRCNGLPITACDVSGGENDGTIYINWTDQRNGLGNTDVWLVKSTDAGNTWTEPIKVNDDSSNKNQFFTWMTIDQVTGFLYFVFYDRRNHDDNATDVYLALSMDGGSTFVNRKISESPFTPYDGIFFGDYTNIVAHNGIVRPIWTRLNNGDLSVWTDLASHQDIILDNFEHTAEQLNFESYPNPSSNITYISFKIRKNATVNLVLFDDLGNKVSTIINGQTKGYGKYIEKIDFDKLKISTGNYVLKLEIDGQIKTSRIVVVK